MPSQEDAGDNKKAENAIIALDNIIIGAYHAQDFENFEIAVKAFVDLALAIEKTKDLEEGTKAKRLNGLIFSKLRDTCIEAIDTPRAPRIIVENLGRIGAEAIEEWRKPSKEIPQTALYAINIIMIVAEACEKESQDPLRFVCVVALGEMFEAANDLQSLKDWIAGKIKGVRDHFKNQRRWNATVGRYLSSIGITS